MALRAGPQPQALLMISYPMQFKWWRALLVGMIAVTSALGSPLRAQEDQSVDSLVNEFLKHGAVARRKPSALYATCPTFTTAQRRAIARLLSARLPRQREDDLANSWHTALERCGSLALEQWFFNRLNEAIKVGGAEARYHLWWALQDSDSPSIRDYLRGLMKDPTLSTPVRAIAGAVLFYRLAPEEMSAEYISAFKRKDMPLEIAAGATDRLLELDAEALLTEVATLVRADVSLALQGAFVQIVESSQKWATPEARRSLGEAMVEGLRKADDTLNPSQRAELQATAKWLMERSPTSQHDVVQERTTGA